MLLMKLKIVTIFPPRKLTLTLIHFQKPIMTAVNGNCLEFGLSLVAMSDLSFASPKVRWMKQLSQELLLIYYRL